MTSVRWNAVIPLPDWNMFPLGPCTTVDVAGESFVCSLCKFPNPYVIVEGAYDKFKENDWAYEEVRKVVAADAGMAISPSSPKLATVQSVPGGGLYFRSRMVFHDNVGAWHNGIAQSALTALGATALAPYTVAQVCLGETSASQFDVYTPFGLRTVSTTVRDGRIHLVLAVGLVTLDPEEGA